jgi:hypothetical protein
LIWDENNWQTQSSDFIDSYSLFLLGVIIPNLPDHPISAPNNTCIAQLRMIDGAKARRGPLRIIRQTAPSLGVIFALSVAGPEINQPAAMSQGRFLYTRARRRVADMLRGGAQNQSLVEDRTLTFKGWHESLAPGELNICAVIPCLFIA